MEGTQSKQVLVFVLYEERIIPNITFVKHRLFSIKLNILYDSVMPVTVTRCISNYSPLYSIGMSRDYAVALAHTRQSVYRICSQQSADSMLEYFFPLVTSSETFDQSVLFYNS